VHNAAAGVRLKEVFVNDILSLFFSAAQVSNRFSSSVAAGSKRMYREKTFKEAWLMDPGAYPIMGIIAIAVTGAVCFTIRRLITDPDVQILSSKQSNPLRGEAAKEVDR
jgi:hypothetical protein